MQVFVCVYVHIRLHDLPVHSRASRPSTGSHRIPVETGTAKSPAVERPIWRKHGDEDGGEKRRGGGGGEEEKEEGRRDVEKCK